MVDRTILTAFLTASALALGIDPTVARRIAYDTIACTAPNPCANASAAGTHPPADGDHD